MAKKKKYTPSKKAQPRIPQKKGKSASKKKKPASKTPWLNSDGAPNKRYKKIAKYLTKDGKIRKNVKLPFKVKTPKALFNKLYNPVYPPWYTKNGKVRKVMLKYLTQKGELRKNVKLPKGVKTIKQLWEWIESGKIKSEIDKRLQCEDFTEPNWVVREMVKTDFKFYRKVFMGGKEITFKEWLLEGYDYIHTITNFDDSPPSVTYTICFFKKYKYLYL